MKPILRYVFWSLLLLAPVCLAGPSAVTADRTAERVQVAEDRFEKAVQLAKQKLDDAIEQAIKSARGKGDLDQVVKLQEEQELYRDTRLMPQAPDVSRDVENYYTSLDRAGDRLISAYERAVEAYTRAEQIDQAKDIQARMEWLRPMRTRLDLGKASSLTSRQVMDLFELPDGSMLNKATLKLHAGDYDQGQGVFKSKAISTSGFHFGFSIKAGAYQIIGAEIDGAKYLYSRGHWKNTAAAIVVAGASKKMTGNDHVVKDGSQFTSMEMQVKDGVLTWFYDGREVHQVDLKNAKPLSQVKLMIGSHNTTFYVRDVHLNTGERITRSTLKRTSDPDVDHESIVETLKSSTVKHNQLVVNERKRLHAAILKAEDEATLATARSVYNREVTSIKQDYIDALQAVLDEALDRGRVEFASKIKSQILRVKSQIDQLSKEVADGVPAADSGDQGGDSIAPEPEPSSPGGDTRDDHVASDTSEEDETGFFGLPLE